MLVLSAGDLNKSYGTDIILEDVSFSVDAGDKVGIIGPNGAGKSTLLSMLSGDIEPTSGNFFVRSGYSIGYLKQGDIFSPDETVEAAAASVHGKFYAMEREMKILSKKLEDSDRPDFEKDLQEYTELLERYKDAGGYTYKSEMNAILGAMGFGAADVRKRVSELSGGERTRLYLSCLLMSKPDILLLDEPTNHLDLGMLAWLEQYLAAYSGTLLVVSHDRFFLDKTATRIFEVENHKVTAYKGNYSDYVVKSKERKEAELAFFEKTERERARQEEMVRRFKQHGTEKLSKRAKSREKMLEKMAPTERPMSHGGSMKLSFDKNFKSGNDVLAADGLKKSFDGETIFENVSFDIKSGDKICIIGNNGVGKTTLLKTMIGECEPDEGYLRVGYNVEFGYYDQRQQGLDENETVLGEMNNAYRLVNDTEMRSILGRFMFRGDDVYKTIKDLSGGEKARLSMLKLMLSGANTLILDEPTNHLDIESKEVLEKAISEFDGTCVIVSHDRYLLNRIPDKIWELTPEGITEYLGKFDYFTEKKRERETLLSAEKGGPDATNEKAEISIAHDPEKERRDRKEAEAEERRRKRKTEALEAKIADLEERMDGLEKKITDPANSDDHEFLHAAATEMETLRRELENAYSEWGDLAD